MTGRFLAAVIALAVFSGCAANDAVLMKTSVFDAAQVSGVRTDLSGMKDDAILRLAEIYFGQATVFFYASQYTGAPLVDRNDILFAEQFKVAPTTGGLKEAQKFNGFMLELARRELRAGRCPEHRAVKLTQVPVVYGWPYAAGDIRKERAGRLILSSGKKTPATPARGFICPVDGRRIIPYNLAGKTKKTSIDNLDAIAGGFIKEDK